MPSRDCTNASWTKRAASSAWKPSATHSGYVSIQSYDAMNTPSTPTRGGTSGAGFFSTGAFCMNLQTIGPCDVATCVTTPPPSVSAGTIMISGAAQAITLTPTATSTYNTFMTANPLFNGGETFASRIANNAAEFDSPAKTGAYIAAGLVLFVLTFVVNAIARIVIERRKAFSE